MTNRQPTDKSEKLFDVGSSTTREDSPVRKTLGTTELIQLIGTGGMGEVWLGIDPKLDRRVAVKMMRRELASDESASTRFYREARSVARLNHPNIIQIFQIGEEDRTLYFSMELVEGETLSQRIKREGAIPLPEALPLLRQIVDALEYACENSVIHRDIKPGNIMMDRRGRIKIADFGLAKVTAGDCQMTSTGVPMGSPNYMSPEQARGDAVDHRSDIYSLGITFYQMLTAALPFQASTPMSVLLKHLQDPLPEPEALRSMQQGRILKLIKWMTAKTQDDRPATYAELKRAVDSLIGGSDNFSIKDAATSSFPNRRPRMLVVLSVIAVVCLIAGAIIGQNMRQKHQRRKASNSTVGIQRSDTSIRMVATPALPLHLPVADMKTTAEQERFRLPSPKERPLANKPLISAAQERLSERSYFQNYNFKEAVNAIKSLLQADLAPARREVLEKRLTTMETLRDLKTAVIHGVTNGDRPEMEDPIHGKIKLVSCTEESLLFENPEGSKHAIPWRELSARQFLLIAMQAVPKGSNTKGFAEFRRTYMDGER